MYEILTPIIKTVLFVGWIGVLELLAIVWTESDKMRTLTSKHRLMLYGAALFAFCLLNIRAEYFGPL